MTFIRRLTDSLIIYTKIIIVLGSILFMYSCKKPSYTLEYSGPSPGSGDVVYPKTPEGEMVKQHLAAMAGVGENAEARYQQSLEKMRTNEALIPVMAEIYEALPEEDYFRRTLIVEALKEMRSESTLEYLEKIANAGIPEDRMSGDEEVDTRESEIVIRITAVEGISILAADSSERAHSILEPLLRHSDLTVRQMAARGYLESSIGTKDEHLRYLYEVVPREEHWYLKDRSDIRQVEYPEVMPDLNLEEFMKQRSEDAPKTNPSQIKP